MSDIKRVKSVKLIGVYLFRYIILNSLMIILNMYWISAASDCIYSKLYVDKGYHEVI